MSTFLRIIGALWGAFGFATCAVGFAENAGDPAMGMTALLIVVLFFLPGLTLYLWGKRMKEKDARQQAMIDALRK